MKSILALLLVLVAVYCYIPGLPQKNYVENDPVDIKTRKLSSIHNVPYDYYSLKFCQPDPLESAAENFGEFMFGDRIENSVFDVCNFLCTNMYRSVSNKT
jgi:transmembrane 9 superfamily protein 2/4